MREEAAWRAHRVVALLEDERDWGLVEEPNLRARGGKRRFRARIVTLKTERPFNCGIRGKADARCRANECEVSKRTSKM